MMKRMAYIYFCICLLVTLNYSQVKPAEKEQSNIEKFSAKSGTLIEKKFSDIGTVKDAKLQVLTLTDLISNAKVSGVRFEKETATRYSTDTKTAFLDQDEIDGLLKSINLIKTKVLPTTPESYTEVVFSSRSGFSAGCYYDKGKWTAFIKLERFDKDSYVYMQAEDFDALANLLQQAKSKMV